MEIYINGLNNASNKSRVISILKKDYNGFIFEAEEAYKYRAEYSDDNDTIYYFKDLFEDEEEKKKVFIKILEEFDKNKITGGYPKSDVQFLIIFPVKQKTRYTIFMSRGASDKATYKLCD
jgi:hypothetical protein